jgi:hypothetical protein
MQGSIKLIEKKGFSLIHDHEFFLKVQFESWSSNPDS